MYSPYRHARRLAIGLTVILLFEAAAYHHVQGMVLGEDRELVMFALESAMGLTLGFIGVGVYAMLRNPKPATPGTSMEETNEP